MFLHVYVILSTVGSIPACLAGLQAHTQGEVEGSGQGGSPGPHPGDVCIPACTEADTPQQAATTAGSMHLAGMHSCFQIKLEIKKIANVVVRV